VTDDNPTKMNIQGRCLAIAGQGNDNVPWRNQYEKVNDMKAIRGAHTADANTAEAIRSCTLEMLTAIMEENHLTTDEIVNATFSATRDLDAAYPAKFARELPGWDNVPLFCVQEMHVEGSLASCIRVMLLTERDKHTAVQHVYLGEAVRLRPDLKRQ